MNDLLISLQSLKKSEALDSSDYYAMIHEKVHYLLVHEINLLFQLLYRIDISENAVKKVFAEYNETSQISKQITLLIRERLKQKIDLRNKYSSKE